MTNMLSGSKSTKKQHPLHVTERIQQRNEVLYWLQDALVAAKTPRLQNKVVKVGMPLVTQYI